MKSSRAGLLARQTERLRRFVAHDDPLAENSNWIAFTIGSHLPFWPLYVWWCTGDGFSPTALFTMAFSPLFLAIPPLSRRSAVASRIAMPVIGIGNTIWTTWILGVGSGSQLFLVACAALSALSFRWHERWLMLGVTTLAPVVWYVMLDVPPVALHRYGPGGLHELFVLNAVSVGVLLALFGWLQTRIYQRMEAR